jgi:hypothetical protein
MKARAKERKKSDTSWRRTERMHLLCLAPVKSLENGTVQEGRRRIVGENKSAGMLRLYLVLESLGAASVCICNNNSICLCEGS